MAEDFLEDDLYNPPAAAFEPPADASGMPQQAPKPASTGIAGAAPQTVYPAPTNDHLDYLHNNPKTAPQFDEVFGPGAAVRSMAKRESQALPWPKQDTIAFKVKPQTFSTQDLLARSTGDPDQLPAPLEGLLRDEDYAARTQRDRAAFNSLRGFYLSEPDLDQAGTWIDQEIVAARKSVAQWDQEIEKAGRTESGGLIYRGGELEQLTTNRRQAQARLDMAQRVANDIRNDVVTNLDAQGRIDLATQIAGQERRVQEMQDVLSGMQDGSIPASPEKLEDYQTDIQMERQSLAQMRSNLSAGSQRKSIDPNSDQSDTAAGIKRSVAGSIENYGRAVGYYFAEMGSAGAAGEWAAEFLADEAKEAQRQQPEQATSFLDLASRWRGDANLARDAQRFAAESLGSALGSAATVLLPAIVVGAATRSKVAGGATDAALNLALGQGEMINALREAFDAEGVDLPPVEQLRPYILTYGSLIGAVEATSDLWLLGGLDRTFGAAARHEIKSGIAAMIAKNAAKGGKIESGEELIQAWVKAIGVNQATGKEWTRDEFLKTMGEAIENAGSAFPGGAALGAGHGARHGGKAQEQIDRQTIDAMIKDAQSEQSKKQLDAGVQAAEQATVTTPEPAPERVAPPSVERFGEPVEGLSDNERTVLGDFADRLKLADQKDSNGVSLADEVSHVVEQDFQDDPAGAEEALGDASIRRLAEMRKEGATFTPEVDSILDRVVEKEAAVSEERAAERRAERQTEEALATLSLDKLPPDAANRIRSEVLDEIAGGKSLAEAIAARQADNARVASSPAFMDVLKSGESFSASNHVEIAKRMGVDKAKLPAIFAEAEKEGLVRKDPQGIWRRGPNAPAVIPSITLTPVDRANAIQHALGEAMKAVGRALPQGLKVQAFTSTAELPESVRGQAEAREAQGQAVEGIYQDGVLYVSAFALSPGAVASHELVHALKAMNLIDAREVRILAEAAQQRGLFDRETYAKAYAGRANLEELLREEAAAHMIEARVARGQTFGGRVDRILDRIQQFLERLSNQLRGLGYQSARDVANAVLSGDVARRGGSLPQAATDRGSFEAAVRNAAAALPENEREAYIAQSLSRFDQGGIDRVFDQEPGAVMSADDIDSVAAMWEQAQEAKKVGRPISLSQWLKGHGGVRDDGGDVLNMLGSSNKAPGLISSKGQSLDDATLKAWEAGFIEGDERPEINTLLDALDEDLRGNRVVAAADREQEQQYQDALQVEQDVADMGVVEPKSADDIRAQLEAKQDVRFAIRDVSTGQSMRRDLDALGFYSHALEAAKGLKQAKGTPEQMLAQLKAAGVKEAEIKATGVDAFLEGQKSVTRDEIVKHLSERRVSLNESILQGKSPDPSKVQEAKTWLEAYAIRTLKDKADAVIQRLRQSERNARAGSAGSLGLRSEAGRAPQGGTASVGAVKERPTGSGEGARARQALDVAAVEYFTGLDLSPEAVAARAKEQLFNTKGWHGTESDFDVPSIKRPGRDFGFHFAIGEPRAANRRMAYEEVDGTPVGPRAVGQRIIPLQVRAHKPFRTADPGEWVQPSSWVNALNPVSLSQHFTDDHAALLDVVRKSKFGETLNNIAAALDRMGYDSIIYKNVIEAAGRDSMFVWHPEQVRSAFDYFDPRAASDKGFLPSTKYVEQDIEAAIAEMEKPMFALRQRPVPSNGNTPALNRSLDELVADLSHALGLTVRTGRIDRNPRNAGARTSVGQINSQTGIVRLKNPQDIETLATLGGHALLQRMPAALHQLMRQNIAEIGAMAPSMPVADGFINFFRSYITNRSAAENAAPNFTRGFESLLESFDPRLLAHLQAVQTQLEIWKNAPSATAIKSAVKSAKRQSLVAQMRSDAEKEGLKTVAERTFDAFYTAVIDDLHPIKLAVDRLIATAEANISVPLAKGVKIGLNAAQDAYKLLRLARNGYQGGHLDQMLGVLGYKQTQRSGPGLRDAIGHALGGFDNWSEDKLQDFGSYLASRRFIAEWRRHENGELENFPDKFSKGDHQQNIRDLLAANPAFAEAALLVYQYQRNLLTKARDAGFVSPEVYDTLVQRVDYVPVNRVMDDTRRSTAEGPGKTGKMALVKGFNGSMRDVINPLESISKFTYELNFLIARNEAIRALDLLARSAGPGGGAIAERLPASQMKGTTVDVMEVLRQAAKTQGLAPEDTVFMIKAVEEALGDESEATIFRPGDISERGEAIIYLWEGGKRIPIKLADGQFGREMYESITGLGKDTLSPILELIAKPTQWLRAGVTLDPAFALANYSRDQASGWLLTEGFTPFASGAWGANEAAKTFFGGNSDVLNQAVGAGMIMGGQAVGSLQEARIKREVARLAKKGIKLTEAVNPGSAGFWELTGMTETGTRVAVFAAAKERAMADGLSEQDAIIEAAFSANDLIDYGRAGSRMLAVRRLVTFLNANLQGTDKAIRVATGRSNSYRDLGDIVTPYLAQTEGTPLRQHEAKDVTLAAKFWWKFGVVLPLLSLGIVLAYKDDPEFQEIPEWMRNTHWLFKLPNGSWVRIPKPFELATSSLVMERAFEAIYHRDPEYLNRLRRGIFDLVLPPTTVPGLNMAYEQWANKVRFSGAPIESEQLAKLPPEMRFTAYTSEFSKWLARGTAAVGVPLSPARLDHAITSVSGGLGRSALGISNMGLPPAYAPRPTANALDTPGLMRFAVDPARASQSKKTLIEQVGSSSGDMSMVANGYKEAMERMTPADADAILRRATPDGRAYALLMYHGSPAEKRNHPMERAKEVLQVTNGLRREIQMGKFRNEDGGYFGPSDQRVVQDMVEQIQMREARNALIVLGHPGYKGLRTLDTEPVLRELETKAPRIYEELSARLREKKVADFADVRDDWQAFKADLLAPGYAEDHPKRPETPAARRRAQ